MSSRYDFVVWRSVASFTAILFLMFVWLLCQCHGCFLNLTFECEIWGGLSNAEELLAFTSTHWDSQRCFELCRLRRTPWGGRYCWWSLWASPWWRSWWFISIGGSFFWGNLVLPAERFSSPWFWLRRRRIRWSCSGTAIGNAAPLIALFFKTEIWWPKLCGIQRAVCDAEHCSAHLNTFDMTAERGIKCQFIIWCFCQSSVIDLCTYAIMHDLVLAWRRRAVPGLKALCLGCEEEQATLPRIEKHMKMCITYTSVWCIY